MMNALAKKVIATQKAVDAVKEQQLVSSLQKDVPAPKPRGEGQGFNSGGDERVRVGVRA
jgi:hypothetical protein